ncbi:MAG: hypothetical protein CMC93_00300 [Flavobacteriaceae bacterium]|nr:hypothetical protein [Flavobacteriaceae bacterium]
MKKTILILAALWLHHQNAIGQVFSYNSMENDQNIVHRVLMDDNYYVETQFTLDTQHFIQTLGGFYEKKGGKIFVNLEFNSNYSIDSLKQLEVMKDNGWKKISKSTMPLQGKWLMAGRVKDSKEQRRDTNRPRKTMKILKDGFFQWIAFNTKTFSFHGSGGGRYSAEGGNYTENIDYFSRDDKKVGISLSFQYQKKGMDWHHTGFSSKGDPLHEIWSARTP